MITLQEVEFYAKVIGSIGSAVAVLYGGFKYLKAGYDQRKQIQTTVEQLAENHLPHIQESLNAHGKTLEILASDMKVMGSQLTDTRAGVHTLGESFLRHLESASKEPVKRKKHASRK